MNEKTRGALARIRYLIVFGVLALPAAAAAQVVQPSAASIESMNERIEAELTSQKIPGVVIGVASRGRLLHVGTYGLADVELRVPVTDSTVFEIGSISKQFTAAAALLLVEDGRLGLDDPIHEHLADLPSEWLGVTVR
jgi:D-alanyl-D-alanine carboxypeptidase